MTVPNYSFVLMIFFFSFCFNKLQQRELTTEIKEKKKNDLDNSIGWQINGWPLILKLCKNILDWYEIEIKSCKIFLIAF